VGNFEHDHGGHSGEGSGKEFGLVDDEGGFHEVGGAEAEVVSGPQVFGEGGEDGNVRVEFNLPGTVEDYEGFFVTGAEGFVEPVEVFEEESVGKEGLG